MPQNSDNPYYDLYRVIQDTRPLESKDTIYARNAMCIDLTLMFGAGNEPATVSEFEALFPEVYYPYNAGELISNDAEAVESVGFNL